MKPLLLQRGIAHCPGRSRPVQRTTLYITRMLWALSMTMVIMGCAGLRAPLQGVSGPVAWQVTDLRMMERAVEGTARDLYTFTLVLKETHGAALTFTSLEQTISDPVLHPAGVSQHASVLWKLHPHGELRHPFSVYWYCTTNDCPRDLMAPAPWYALVLTGTDDRGQPVRVTMDFKLPMGPAGPKIAPVPTTASPSPPGPAVVSQQASGPVPFQTIHNHIWLHAVLNHREQVTLLLDTGTAHTLITPDTAKRLGLSPTAETPKQALRVLGGHQVEVPLILLASVAVGQTAVRNVPVGVVASFPDVLLVDGLLGADVLRHFTLTLDYAASRLTLVPQGLQPPSPATLAAARGVVHGPIPLRLGPPHVLVRAVLHGQEPVSLLLDTGASHTLLTPAIARRLGLSPTADAPTKTLTRADGQLHTVPLVVCKALAVGEAVVEQLPVGITDVDPTAPAVEGLLGVDFLARFTVTLDYGTRQLWLAVPQAVSP